VTIQEAAAALRERRVSSVELTSAALASIERLNPSLNAFITVTAEEALASARRADEQLAQGNAGPLCGIPVAVKDIFYTRGVRTTGGSKLYENFVPEYDAAAVERLRSAGAVLTGKLSLHELAYGITSNNPHFGPVRNPWDTERIPGGSSGGSGAAVAAGMVFMAMGSDTGGSIRIPASYCGTVGLKPTFGRVSRYGVMPLGFSLDHMGPLTRSVRDAAVVLEAIAGYDARDAGSVRSTLDPCVPAEGCSIRGTRIGVPENFYFDRLAPDVSAAVRAAAARASSLGAEIVPLTVPDVAALNGVARIVLLAEASALMEAHRHRRNDFGADVLALLDQGRLLAATDYVNAQRLRRTLQAQFRALWERADCLLMPATPNTAPKIGESAVAIGGEPEDVRLAATRLVRGINALGLPALSMPCGLDGRGLPIGLQIVGPEFGEAVVLRVGAALEDNGMVISPCPLD
jgi:aspartyl-tRNA(Asn)/glutamyl-tRNA(Gln) amidotransferase subunit A